MTFKKYRRTNIAEMRPVEQSEVEYFKTQKALYNDTGEFQISISDADIKNGSPKIGDMIARNPDNHDDVWLIAKEYFEKNFAPVADADRFMTLDYRAIAKGIIQTTNIMDTMCHPDRNHWERVSDQDSGAVDHIAGTIKKAIFKQLQTIDHADH